MLFQDALLEVAKFEPTHAEPFAKLPYEAELALKNEALRLFWEGNRLGDFPRALVPSPLPRKYRTTSKRRVFFDGGVSFEPKASLLEPSEHAGIYKLVLERLKEPAFKHLARALNWLIIRGTYKYRVVIFNVDHLDAVIVRKLKQMAEHLKNSPFGVTAAHAYVDPIRSDYYLEAARPTSGLSFKQLYGPKELSLKLPEFSLRYPVTGFSQINESQIPNLLSTAAELATLDDKTAFMDLYCGYGLFAFGIGTAAKSVLGAEWEGPSVEAAKASARHLKLPRHKFLAGKIDARFVENLPAPSGREVVLLDPPRKGTLPGVVEAIAERKPEKILHIFCGTDEIPGAVLEWENSGYKVKVAAPLDLFPGTAHVETIILLERS